MMKREHNKAYPLPDTVTILFIGHGSRRAQSNQEVSSLVALFQKKHPQLRTTHCFVELAKPSFNQKIFEEAARPECRLLIILPLFLFSSRHVKNDIPLVVSKVKAQFPDKEIICADSMKASKILVQLSIQRISEAKTKSENKGQSLLIIGRGSSDPDSNGEFEKIARLIFEQGPFEAYHTAFVGITGPKVEAQLNFIAKSRPKTLTVFPYFLFQGRLIEQLKEKLEDFKHSYPWIQTHITRPLGVDPKLVDYFSEHVHKILRGDVSQTLACTTCHYRPELESISAQVKGVEALLWSVRHLYTHSQAKPHEYPHANLKKHVLVCENIDCAERGSKQFTRRLRKLIKKDGHEQVMKVTKTSCMGRCGEGPSLAVYPDGVWYRDVKLNDIDDIYQQHLLNDKIHEPCVDDIMV